MFRNLKIANIIRATIVVITALFMLLAVSGKVSAYADSTSEMTYYQPIIDCYEAAAENPSNAFKNDLNQYLIPDYVTFNGAITGYSVYDIDGNGTNELLIMNRNNQPVDIYTVKNGAAIHALPFPAGSIDTSWYILENGRVLTIDRSSYSSGLIEYWDINGDSDPVFTYISGGQYETDETMLSSYGESYTDFLLSADDYAMYMSMISEAITFGSGGSVAITTFSAVTQ